MTTQQQIDQRPAPEETLADLDQSATLAETPEMVEQRMLAILKDHLPGSLSHTHDVLPDTYEADQLLDIYGNNGSLRGCRLHDSQVIGSLEGANLSYTILERVDLSMTSLKNANLRGPRGATEDYSSATIVFPTEAADLEGVDLSYRNMQHCDLRDRDFSTAKMQGAILADAQLVGTVLPSDLRGVKFNKAYLENVDLSHCDLSGADFTGAVFGAGVILPQNLSGVILREVDLSPVDVSGRNFTAADLSMARLGANDLSSAVLAGSKLDLADLSRVTLSETQDFRHTHMNGATLPVGYSMRNARVEYAVLNSVGLEIEDLPLNLEGTKVPTLDWSGRDLTAYTLKGTHFNLGTLDGVTFPHDLRGITIAEGCFKDPNSLPINLTAHDVRGATFNWAAVSNIFDQVQLPKDLRDCTISSSISDVDLSDCNVDGVTFSFGSLERVTLPPSAQGLTFRACRLEEMDLSKVEGDALRFKKGYLREVPLPQDLSGAEFIGTTLVNMDFSKSIIDGMSLSSSEFLRCEFPSVSNGVDVTKCKFQFCDLEHVDFGKTLGAPASVEGTQLSKELSAYWSFCPNGTVDLIEALDALADEEGVVYTLALPRRSVPRHAHLYAMIRDGDELYLMGYDDESAVNGINLYTAIKIDLANPRLYLLEHNHVHTVADNFNGITNAAPTTSAEALQWLNVVVAQDMDRSFSGNPKVQHEIVGRGAVLKKHWLETGAKENYLLAEESGEAVRESVDNKIRGL